MLYYILNIGVLWSRKIPHLTGSQKKKKSHEAMLSQKCSTISSAIYKCLILTIFVFVSFLKISLLYIITYSYSFIVVLC